MIRVVVLPEKKEYVFKEDKLVLKEIMERIGIEDPESVAVVYNGRIVEDPEQVIKSDGDLKIIIQGIGG